MQYKVHAVLISKPSHVYWELRDWFREVNSHLAQALRESRSSFNRSEEQKSFDQCRM